MHLDAACAPCDVFVSQQQLRGGPVAIGGPGATLRTKQPSGIRCWVFTIARAQCCAAAACDAQGHCGLSGAWATQQRVVCSLLRLAAALLLVGAGLEQPAPLTCSGRVRRSREGCKIRCASSRALARRASAPPGARCPGRAAVRWGRTAGDMAMSVLRCYAGGASCMPGGARALGRANGREVRSMPVRQCTASRQPPNGPRSGRDERVRDAKRQRGPGRDNCRCLMPCLLYAGRMRLAVRPEHPPKLLQPPATLQPQGHTATRYCTRCILSLLPSARVPANCRAHRTTPTVLLAAMAPPPRGHRFKTATCTCLSRCRPLLRLP